jgi:hypothetical protein
MVTALRRGGVALGDRCWLRVWAESAEEGGNRREMILFDPEQRPSSTRDFSHATLLQLYILHCSKCT